MVLESLSKKLARHSVRTVLHLRTKIRHYKPKKDGKEGLRDIYIEIYRVLEELDELQKDSRWER